MKTLRKNAGGGEGSGSPVWHGQLHRDIYAIAAGLDKPKTAIKIRSRITGTDGEINGKTGCSRLSADFRKTQATKALSTKSCKQGDIYDADCACLASHEHASYGRFGKHEDAVFRMRELGTVTHLLRATLHLEQLCQSSSRQLKRSKLRSMNIAVKVGKKRFIRLSGRPQTHTHGDTFGKAASPR